MKILTAKIHDNEKNDIGKIIFSSEGLSFEGFTDSEIESRLREHYHRDYETLTGGQKGLINYTEMVTYKAGTRKHFEAVTIELHFLKWEDRPGFFLGTEIIRG
jgi:hypothetical protein